MPRTRTGVFALILALVAGSAVGSERADKPDKDKKAAKPQAATASSGADLIQQAAQKAAAGDADGAIELLTKAAGMPGEGGQASLALGQVLAAKGQLDSASEAYRAASQKLSGAAKGEALGRLALTEELQGRPGNQVADEALAADPQGLWALSAAVYVKAREGRADEALALAQQAEAKGASASVLGRAREAKGDLAAAETAYRTALADPAEKLPATLGLARTLRRAGRPAEALPLLREMIEAQPGVLAAYKESARTYLALDQPEEALSDATLADAMAEQDAEARQLRDECAVAKAVYVAARGHGALAQQDLQRLIDQTPGSAELWLGLGRVHIAQRQPQPALLALAKAIELQPASAAAHFQSGYVQHMLKRDAAAALPWYDKAVKLEPVNLEYRTQLGGVLVALGQSERAVTELGQVTATPGYAKAEGFMYLGAAQLGAKRYADALVALRQAATLAPDNVQVETFLAWACFGQKDSPGFLSHAKKAKALGQQDTTLLQYLARIEKGEPIK